MNIKTITCHDVYNYGASLQAYALQEYLISQGHNVEIIDYKPDYMRIHYKFWYIHEKSRYYRLAKKLWFVRFMLCCYFAPSKYATIGRKKNFDKFTKKHLHLTKRFNSYEELTAGAPTADAYIAGSDQIWNCNLPNGKDGGYFLQFGNENTKRIAYAASFGISEVPEENRKQMKVWLDKFDAISVREKTGVKILDTIGVKGIEVTDPVYLLTQEQWGCLAGSQRVVKDKYILVYDLTLNDIRLKEEAERLSKKYGYKIVSVDGAKKCPYAKKNISNAGPQEFVNLIKNAEFIVTNSFHATSFSVIFNRPFVTYYKSHNISRIADLLNNIEMEQQLNPAVAGYKFDWERINEKLKNMRSASYLFLKNNTK